MRTPYSSGPAASQRGFTLIELMVGLLMSLLTVLAITLMLLNAEEKKRAVSMGSDAQTNGAMSLYALQRDIQMAGYGATSNMDSLGCAVQAQHGSKAPFTFTLAPVVIADGASGAPDTITVMRGGAAAASLPMLLTSKHDQADDHFTVSSTFGAAVGNIMIAVPKSQSGTGCALFEVADSASPMMSATVLPHVAGASYQWNQAGVIPTGGYAKDDYLLSMKSLVLRSYSISITNSLSVSDLSSATGLPVSQDLYPQIVNLQAMYGKGTVDAAGNVIVDTYDNKTPTTNAEWQSVVVIRIALVARSNQYVKDSITLSPPQWDLGTTGKVVPATTPCKSGGGKCIDLKVDQVGADWQHYRYKVFDTIVPLRNVLWNS